MALLWVDGFDNYGTTTGSAPSPSGVIARNYLLGGASSSEGNTKIQAGRTGSAYALDLGGYNVNLVKQALATTNGTLICGVGVYITGPAPLNSGISLITFYDDSTSGVELRTNANGTMYIYAGSTTVATTTFALSVNTWYYLELKIVCTSASNYNYELRLGQTTLLSGSDTHKAGTHSYLNGVSWNGNNYHYGLVIDDLYIADGSGSYNNDFCGNIYVQLVYPDGDGGTNEWTTSTGTSHYALVSETISDDTSYLESSTSGQIELFTFGDVVATGNIKGVAVLVESRETDAQSFTLKTQCVSGATTSNGAVQVGGMSAYTTKLEMYETDPNTGLPWTNADFNAAKFGFVLQ